MRIPSQNVESVVSRLRAAGCVFAEDEARLLIEAAGTSAELDSLVERRVAGTPLEYVLGWAEFHGLRIAVDPGVFVPRRRTEFLVDRAADLVAVAGPRPDPLVVVDLCCGCGALGVALAHAVDVPVELHAADVDPAAVRCARRNVSRVGGRVYVGDLYAALPARLRGRIDVLLVNAPYVPTDAIALMPPEARLYEAAVALDGGADGLDVVRRVVAGAPDWLSRGGHLLIESSAEQAPEVAAAYAEHGIEPTVDQRDDVGATVVVGTLPGSRA